MDKRIYILQKDLPNVKAGAELTWNSTETWTTKCEGGRYGIWDMPSENSCTQIWSPEDVENNPEWFKLKQQEPIYVISFIYKLVENYEGSLYKFLTNNPIPPEKYELIKRAIEFVLNDKEEVKRWEITRFRYFESNFNDVFLRDGKYRYASGSDAGFVSDLETIIKNGSWIVKEVRRLPDGKIFKVGDRIKVFRNSGYIGERTIHGFIIEEGVLKEVDELGKSRLDQINHNVNQ